MLIGICGFEKGRVILLTSPWQSWQATFPSETCLLWEK